MSLTVLHISVPIITCGHLLGVTLGQGEDSGGSSALLLQPSVPRGVEKRAKRLQAVPLDEQLRILVFSVAGCVTLQGDTYSHCVSISLCV